jgi:hypothetical protein
LVQEEVKKVSHFPGSYFSESPKMLVDMTVPWLAAQKFGQLPQLGQQLQQQHQTSSFVFPL